MLIRRLMIPLVAVAMVAATSGSAVHASTGGRQGGTDSAIAQIGPGVAASGVTVESFAVQTADGAVLRGRVYLPAAPGPLATVLEFSPYFNSTAVVATTPPQNHANPDPALTLIHQKLLANGFAVALVNMRGTGSSDGCFQWGSRTDWSDAGRVVDVLASRPWSNGNIGMVGHSFAGWSQYMAMATAPPALKAVVPTSGVIDVWSLLARRGAPINIGPAVPPVWTVGTAFGASTPIATRAGCTEPAQHTTENAELATSGDRMPYMVERDLRPALRNSHVAVLASSGFPEAHRLQYEGLWDLLRRDRAHFVLGQWGHTTPTNGGRSDWLDLSVGWLDRYLRGGPEVVTPGVVEYQDTAGTWHTASRWPPPAKTKSVFLSDGQLLDSASRVTTSEATFSTVDLDPGSACGPHQALYVSPPLAKDVLLAGNFQARLTVTSDQPGGNLAAFLKHTPGDGSCQDVADNSRNVGRVQLDLRHAVELGRSRDFPVGAATAVDVPSEPLATFIPRGHRLVLAVGGGAEELLPDPLRSQLTISTGRTLLGELVLPVVRGPLKFSGA